MRSTSRRLTAIALAGMALIGAGCDTDLAEPDVAGPQSPPITVTATATALAANGVDTSRVSVSLGPSIPDGQEVTFEVSEGGFRTGVGDTAKNFKSRTSGRLAAATYVAGRRPGSPVLQVSVAGEVATVAISLSEAGPTEILLSADKSAADTSGGSAIAFTARLIRDDGTVSRGLRVRFRADDGGGAPFDDLIGDAFVEGTSVTHSVTSSIPRTVVMRAEAGGVESNTVTVVFR